MASTIVVIIIVLLLEILVVLEKKVHKRKVGVGGPLCYDVILRIDSRVFI